ncbi:MAG TPA: hypothetical protein VGE07_21225 [Herpetosiphonaceae bacterium]
MPAPIDRSEVLKALQLTDTAKSSYLDLETGKVILIDDTATDADTEARRTEIMEGYGDRFRYVSGGQADASDASVQEWLDGEGLS